MAHPYKSHAHKGDPKWVGGIKKYDIGGAVRPVPMTPDVASRMQRRLQNAGGDDDVRRVVNDAAKYGVDWSHLLPSD